MQRFGDVAVRQSADVDRGDRVDHLIGILFDRLCGLQACPDARHDDRLNAGLLRKRRADHRADCERRHAAKQHFLHLCEVFHEVPPKSFQPKPAPRVRLIGLIS